MGGRGPRRRHADRQDIEDRRRRDPGACPRGRRDRLLDTWARYAAGESVRQIEKATGRARATVSTDLQTVEHWTGKRFMRRTPGRHTKGQTSSIKAAIARVTRTEREQGQKAAKV